MEDAAEQRKRGPWVRMGEWSRYRRDRRAWRRERRKGTIDPSVPLRADGAAAAASAKGAPNDGPAGGLGGFF
jgi:hypothetical protein